MEPPPSSFWTSFRARLVERLSPRTWALEWLALAVAVLGLAGQLWPQIWPMSLREQLVAEGELAEAKVASVTLFNQRNTRWGTTKKIGATLPVYLLDLSWEDSAGTRLAVVSFPVSYSDGNALKLNLVPAPLPAKLRIRFLLPQAGMSGTPGDQPPVQAADAPPPCYPAALCVRVLLDAVNSADARKFGDRPEPGLALVGLLVFVAMLGFRALVLLLYG
jgi:hypothetical protein